jgi:hypothetical protein
VPGLAHICAGTGHICARTGYPEPETSTPGDTPSLHRKPCGVRNNSTPPSITHPVQLFTKDQKPTELPNEVPRGPPARPGPESYAPQSGCDVRAGGRAPGLQAHAWRGGVGWKARRAGWCEGVGLIKRSVVDRCFARGCFSRPVWLPFRFRAGHGGQRAFLHGGVCTVRSASPLSMLSASLGHTPTAHRTTRRAAQSRSLGCSVHTSRTHTSRTHTSRTHTSRTHTSRTRARTFKLPQVRGHEPQAA